MTDEEINVKVAEKMGWQHQLTTVDSPVEKDGMRLPNYFGPSIEAWWHPTIEGVWVNPPKFTTSLDACSQFERTLTDKEIKGYIECLKDLLRAHMNSYRSVWAKITASPLQRCKAYLIVKGVEV